MVTFIDPKKIQEMKLMADVELLIHAFVVAEMEQFFEKVSKGQPRDVQYPTLKSALASDVISCVRKHDYEQRRK